MLLYLFQVPNNEICTLAVTCYLSSNLICLLYKGAENISKCFLFHCLNCNFPSFQHGNLMKKKKHPTWTITLNISLAWSLRFLWKFTLVKDVHRKLILKVHKLLSKVSFFSIGITSASVLLPRKNNSYRLLYTLRG